MKSTPKQTQKLIKKHVILFSFMIAWIICFFLGIFYEGVRITAHDAHRAYYINRGYPYTWAGVAKAQSKVDFPIVVAPLTTIQRDGDVFTKVIDLRVFLPLFVLVWALSLPLARGLTKLMAKNKWTTPVYVALILFTLLVYFQWFPRI